MAKTMAGFASIATNTEIIHVLFRTLVDAFAPKPGKKYWRLNIGTLIDDNYDEIGEMDDAKALPALLKVTNKYIVDKDVMITECANALKSSLKKD
jgi:hypothetical protein